MTERPLRFRSLEVEEGRPGSWQTLDVDGNRSTATFLRPQLTRIFLELSTNKKESYFDLLKAEIKSGTGSQYLKLPPSIEVSSRHLSAFLSVPLRLKDHSRFANQSFLEQDWRKVGECRQVKKGIETFQSQTQSERVPRVSWRHWSCDRLFPIWERFSIYYILCLKTALA